MKKNCKFILVILFIFCFNITANAQNNVAELCDNGIDDDGDGLTDLNDTDCICSAREIPAIIPNPSFESHSDCPQWFNFLDYCASWKVANGGSSDYINSCNVFMTAITNAGLTPFPDGNGILGAIFQQGYKEYIGTCLLSPIYAGNNYTIKLKIASLPVTETGESCNNGIINYGTVNITVFGKAGCENFLAATGDSPNTANPEWMVIGHVAYNPASQWSGLIIPIAAPVNINAICIGAPENLPTSYPPYESEGCRPYFLYDDLHIESNPFQPEVEIRQTGNICSNNLLLTATPQPPVSNAATYQWYKNGNAITGATQGQYAITTAENTIGDYIVRITGNNGCSLSEVFNASLLPEFPELTIIQPDCLSATGTIAITTPAEEYSFDNGITWVTQNSIENLLPGNYIIKAKYTTNCITPPIYITINPYQNNPPGISILQPASCEEGGTIYFENTGGRYSIDNGITWHDNPMFPGLPEGDYPTKTKDADECVSATGFAHITGIRTSPPAYIAIQPNCHTDGKLTITAAAQEYSFDGGNTWQESNILDNLTMGYYEMMVRNANGCTSYPSFEFIAPVQTLPDAPLINVQQPLSCISPLGSITVTTRALQYSFDNGLTWTAGNTSGALLPGLYRVKIKNAQGCQSPDTVVEIQIPADMPATPVINVTQPSCSQPLAIIAVTTIAAQYSFNNGTTWGNSNTLNNAAAGTYFIKTRNNAGCESAAIEVNINAITQPLAPLINHVTYCQNEPAIPLSGTGTNLLWYNTQTGGNGTITAPVPNTSLPGTLTYYASQTVNGCESPRAAVTVIIYAIPVAPITTTRIVYCQYALAAPLNANGTNIIWYPTQTGGAGSSIHPVPSTAQAGSVTYYASQSINGCESARVAINVIINPIPDVPRVVSPVNYSYGDIVLPLTATGTSLKWYDKDMDFISATAPVPSTFRAGATLYYVTNVMDGCESLPSEILVNVRPEELLFDCPKFFTPNGDGTNETWNIRDLRGKKAIVYIFDRYGRVLTSLRPNGPGWDGTYNGNKLPATDYWFKVKFIENGNEQEFKSHFALIR